MAQLYKRHLQFSQVYELNLHREHEVGCFRGMGSQFTTMASRCVEKVDTQSKVDSIDVVECPIRYTTFAESRFISSFFCDLRQTTDFGCEMKSSDGKFHSCSPLDGNVTSMDRSCRECLKGYIPLRTRLHWSALVPHKHAFTRIHSLEAIPEEVEADYTN
mmetsp:Transcript_12203/g.32860  ORF Transcript_12203/g.32860 Transcript_12203/m.32860 type:complete len:160 (-) Transcript_12203:647-1126(-)